MQLPFGEWLPDQPDHLNPGATVATNVYHAQSSYKPVKGLVPYSGTSNVLQNAKEISDKGIKEIVLTGVNIGDYGKGEFGNKNHEHTFLDLVKQLDGIEGIERLRISSIDCPESRFLSMIETW